ncbi:hypothetical protein [Chitinophaga sp.]|uniref:hypothetical protein n=1 Tax=Chitinophaga sp. TaxID=1869181 RepID=UPI0031D1B6FD
MLQLKTDNTIRNRFLFVFLFMTILGGLTGRAGNISIDLPIDSTNDVKIVNGSVSAVHADHDISIHFQTANSSVTTVHLEHDPAACSQTAHRYQELTFRAQPSRRQQHLSFRPLAYRPHFDLNKPSNFFIHLPHSLMEDIPEDITEDQVAFIFRAHEPRHKRRFYISVTSQQYSFTTRLQQLQLLLDQYIPEDEDKTGIYQWHDAFLPAYYKFLFRYTLF